ncbi:MAG: hypothetical protein DRI86_07185 [Bacteroidetes bacterium]|nr:MAG: hypothetical protein DRI86_07185 [Bacteroidota bacterium]
MKRITFIVIIAVISTVILTSVTSKKKNKQFRGTITYDLSYESDELTSIEISKFPKSQTVMMYDGMSKFDIEKPGGGLTYISNPETDQFMVLIESGLRKAAIITKLSEIEAKQDSAREYTTQIDLSEDKKEIAGYICNKAIVTFTPKPGIITVERMFSVYYCPKLGNLKSNEGGPYEGINGELLEYYNVSSQIITKMVATEIKKGKVSDLDFFLPSDFKEFTPDQEKELMDYLQGK